MKKQIKKKVLFKLGLPLAVRWVMVMALLSLVYFEPRVATAAENWEFDFDNATSDNAQDIEVVVAGADNVSVVSLISEPGPFSVSSGPGGSIHISWTGMPVTPDHTLSVEFSLDPIAGQEPSVSSATWTPDGKAVGQIDIHVRRLPDSGSTLLLCALGCGALGSFRRAFPRLCIGS